MAVFDISCRFKIIYKSFVYWSLKFIRLHSILLRQNCINCRQYGMLRWWLQLVSRCWCPKSSKIQTTLFLFHIYSVPKRPHLLIRRCDTNWFGSITWPKFWRSYLSSLPSIWKRPPACTSKWYCVYAYCVFGYHNQITFISHKQALDGEWRKNLGSTHFTKHIFSCSHWAVRWIP